MCCFYWVRACNCNIKGTNGDSVVNHLLASQLCAMVNETVLNAQLGDIFNAELTEGQNIGQRSLWHFRHLLPLGVNSDPLVPNRVLLALQLALGNLPWAMSTEVLFLVAFNWPVFAATFFPRAA